MWRYGIGETPPKKGYMIMMQKKKEKDKQYEAKCVRSNIQSRLAGRSWLRYDKNSKKMFCDYSGACPGGGAQGAWAPP